MSTAQRIFDEQGPKPNGLVQAWGSLLQQAERYGYSSEEIARILGERIPDSSNLTRNGIRKIRAQAKRSLERIPKETADDDSIEQLILASDTIFLRSFIAGLDKLPVAASERNTVNDVAPIQTESPAPFPEMNPRARLGRPELMPTARHKWVRKKKQKSWQFAILMGAILLSTVLVFFHLLDQPSQETSSGRYNLDELQGGNRTSAERSSTVGEVEHSRSRAVAVEAVPVKSESAVQVAPRDPGNGGLDNKANSLHGSESEREILSADDTLSTTGSGDSTLVVAPQLSAKLFASRQGSSPGSKESAEDALEEQEKSTVLQSTPWDDSSEGDSIRIRGSLPKSTSAAIPKGNLLPILDQEIQPITNSDSTFYFLPDLRTLLIRFEWKSDELPAEAQAILRRIAEYLMKQEGSKVVLTGHTDSMGEPVYNVNLSKVRALIVQDFLLGLNVDGGSIVVQAMGPYKPIANNDTREGREVNRRVELEILDKQDTRVDLSQFVSDMGAAVPQQK